MNLGAFNILFIDDDEDEYINIRDLFNESSRSQFNIVWMSTYEGGLNALCKDSFDACLLDYRLGERTGIELLKDASGCNISCPIIFLTGQGDFDIDVEAMQIGASDYLVKDQLTAPLLERTVRYAMKHHLDMQQLRENKAQILQQDRLASLGLLASSLAHEIGTPMGIIRSRAELALRKLNDPSAMQESVEIIICQIDKITKLVNSLLHLARGKSGGQSTSVNLDQVIQDVLNLVRHELDRKEISLDLQVHENLVVKAESGPLGQVLLNLFVNAVHAIEEEKSTGRATDFKIILSAEDVGEKIQIRVQDNGCGIPEKNLSQIFKPFFTTKQIGVGSGLGLATTYNLVRSWGGTITVASQDRQGTTFEISLPKAN